MARKRVERNISFDDVRKVYYVSMDLGKNSEGKRVKQYRTFPNLTSARTGLREFYADRDKLLHPPKQEQTLRQWLDYWMENIIRPNRAETTVYAYQKIIDNHLDPLLGAVPLSKLSPKQIQEYYQTMTRTEGLSSNTIRRHHDLLSAALRMAVRQEAGREQARPSPLGLRREEICGLKWESVDFQRRVVHIKEARTAYGATVVQKETKNRSSMRTLFMPDELYELLRREKARQEQERAIRGGPLDMWCWTERDCPTPPTPCPWPSPGSCGRTTFPGSPSMDCATPSPPSPLPRASLCSTSAKPWDTAPPPPPAGSTPTWWTAPMRRPCCWSPPP